MLEYNIKQAPSNHVIVEVGQAYDDTVTLGKMTLHIDHEFNPTMHARIYGRVVGVPKGKCLDESGLEIEKDVQVGDIIYFHYLVTHEESNCIGGNYYKVPYYWIFCSVRNGDILPVGSWTLLEPSIEEDFNKIEVNGVMLEAVVSSSGLVTSVSKKKSTKYAVVKHIGKPLPEEGDIGIGVGSKVVLEPNSNFTNKIEGVDYYTVKQRYILSKAI